MRIFCLTLILFLGLATAANAVANPYTAYSPRLRVDPGIWQFQTREAMERVLARNITKPRACYYLINQADRLQMEIDLALVVKKYHDRKPNDPKIRAVYAYATMIATSNGTTQPGGWDRVKSNNLFAEKGIAFTLLDAGMKKNSNAYAAAEIQLMKAACELERLSGRPGVAQQSWDKVFNLVRRAINRAPSWSDPYYWQSSAFITYARQWNPELPDATERKWLLRAIEPAQTAQKLDSSRPMQGSCARMLMSAAYYAHQYKEAVHYIDIWFKYLPEFGRMEQFRDLRRYAVRQAQ